MSIDPDNYIKRKVYMKEEANSIHPDSYKRVRVSPNTVCTIIDRRGSNFILKCDEDVLLADVKLISSNERDFFELESELEYSIRRANNEGRR